MPNLIALDLSKASTGFAIGCYDEATHQISIPTTGSFRIPNAANYSKFYFRAKDHLLAALTEWLADYQLTSIVFETPIFHGAASELQFYLTQEVIAFAARHMLDIVGYSPMGIKSFAKQWSTTVTTSRPSKNELLWIYQTFVQPKNHTFLPQTPNSDDQTDALFLVLMALLAQSHILRDIPIPLITDKKDPWLDQYGDYYLLSGNHTLHAKFYQSHLAPITNLVVPAPIPTSRILPRPLHKYFKDLKANDFLLLTQPFFYPFRRLAGLTNLLKQIILLDRDIAIELLQPRMAPNMRIHNMQETFKQEWTLGLNRKGELFFDHLTHKHPRAMNLTGPNPDFMLPIAE